MTQKTDDFEYLLFVIFFFGLLWFVSMSLGMGS